MIHEAERAGLRERVEEVLRTIRPYLAADGGNIELVAVEGGCVKVRLLGACAGCPSSRETLRFGVETTIKEYLPEVSAVIAV